MKEQKKQPRLTDNAAEEKQVREVRHTISTEETFTLAKDVFDLRCLIKNIYANRAQIARRLNIVSLGFSIVYTVLYISIMLYISIAGKLSLGWKIAVYVLAGVYVLFAAQLIVFAIFIAGGATTKTVRRNNKILKILRYFVRVSSLAMSIAALCVSRIQPDALNIALKVVLIVISAISIIIATVPLLCGGIGGAARWLMSPTKRKISFSAVVLEWYNLLTEDSTAYSSVQHVERKLSADIGRCIDSYILPACGNKKIGSIGTNQIFSLIERTPEEDRAVTEGIIKNVFEYALECNYIQIDPCRDLKLEGSIEVVQKPKKESFKMRIGKKIGKSIVKQFLGDDEKAK